MLQALYFKCVCLLVGISLFAGSYYISMFAQSHYSFRSVALPFQWCLYFCAPMQVTLRRVRPLSTPLQQVIEGSLARLPALGGSAVLFSESSARAVQ